MAADAITLVGNSNINSSITIGLPKQTESSISFGADVDTTVSFDTKNKTVTKTGTNKNAGEVISDIAAQSNALVGAYGSLTTKVKQMTGISLPDASTISGVSNVLSGLNTINNVRSTFVNNQNASRTQADSINPQAGAFKWVEKETVPADFVSYDSVLLFIGEPLYADNPKGATFVPLGLCEQFNIATSNQVTTLQELRCEEQIVLPGKSQPVSVSMSRFCGKWSNLLNRLHNNNTDLKWCMSTQYKGMRNLFGIYGIVMDTSRRNIIHSFYIERCAIETVNFGISAGQMNIIESCTIRAGRIVDPNYVPQVSTTLSSGTGNTTKLSEDTNTNLDTEKSKEEKTEEKADDTINQNGALLDNATIDKLQEEIKENPWEWSLSCNDDYLSLINTSGVAKSDTEAKVLAENAKVTFTETLRAEASKKISELGQTLESQKRALVKQETILKTFQEALKSAQKENNTKVINSYKDRISVTKSNISFYKNSIEKLPQKQAKLSQLISSGSFNIKTKISKR